MGFLGFGDKKQEQQAQPQQQQQQAQTQQQPQQQETLVQRVQRIWHSNQNYVTKAGFEFDWQLKKQMDTRLFNNLGTTNIDSLLEIKAPIFFESFYNLCEWIVNMGRNVRFIKKNMQSNNDYQQLLGKYEELQKHCEKQDALIQKFMENHSEIKHHSPAPSDNGFVR